MASLNPNPTVAGRRPVVRPTVLCMWVAADRANLQQLLDDPQLEIADTLESQLAELVQTRTPSRKLSAREAREAAAELVGPRPVAEYGTWVHYSWSRRLVHVLPPEDFIELRTSRNRYLITAPEQATLATKRVGIVGLSVGQSVAFAIALERGAGELRLADFDTLELSNLNRLRGTVHDLGLSKVAIAARAIAELDPYLDVRTFSQGLTEANADQFFNDGGRLDLVVDECDGLDMKVRLREKARELGIPVVMQTSDRGMLDIERFDMEPARPFFHGLAGDLRAADLVGLTNEQKVPTLLKIIGVEGLSTRIRASLVEVEQSIRTWPQLGSAVTLGAGLAADAARRILLGQLRQSGRFYVDLGQLVADPAEGAAPAPPSVSEELIRKLVGRAILAPSGGNHQPWRWTARGNRLELREDTSHRMGLTDSDNLGTAVALGAAAESLVLAAHAEGLELSLDVAEDAGELVATFDLGVAAGAGEPHAFDALEAQLERRHTDRRMGDQTWLKHAQCAELLVAATSLDGVGLRLVTARAQIEELAALIGQGDRLRILDPGLSREMFAELRWTQAEAEATGDGLEVDSLALSATDRAGLELCRNPEALALVAEWGLGSGLVRLGQRWASASSALGLLTVTPADRAGYFRAGRAMQRLWLTAVANGLALHPLTFLPYAFGGLCAARPDCAPATLRGLEGLRAPYVRLLNLDGSEGEVLLFRILRADTLAPASVRRPVDAVLQVAQG